MAYGESKKSALFVLLIIGIICLVGCNSKVDVHSKDELGNIPLMDAISDNDLENVKELIDKGSDINAENVDDMTPLFKAIMHSGNGTEMVELLLNLGADQSIKLIQVQQNPSMGTICYIPLLDTGNST